MTDSTQHDDLLFSMLKECRTLPIFLDHIFGFLSRRTDFYHVATDSNSPIGLPNGLAEHTVKQTFYKWKSQIKLPVNDNPENESPKQPIIEKIEKPTSSHFTTSESYNGAVYDTYSWSQTLLEIDIIVKIPDKVSAKDLIVTILCDKISVKIKNGNTLLEGDLCDKCKHSDAIWSVNQNKLEIHLDKAKEVWWNCLVQSEPKLDISKLDCSRPFEELPDEAQVKIEEMQWNQERKRLGLPTSDEMSMQSILKQSWNAEGSPFSGPFDPSTVKFS